MARAPYLGAVKSRLAVTVGDERALAIYRSLAEHTVAVARASRLEVCVAFTPRDALADMRRWLGDGLRQEAQSDGDLGDRMATAMTREFARGAARVVVVGTDCPALTAAIVQAALAALDTADVVYGPTADGGFYLVGARAAHPSLFRDVPWSAADTLQVALARADDAGLSVALLPQLRDVDTEADWQWYLDQPAAPS